MTTENLVTEKDFNRNPVLPVLIALAAWIVPGLGHLCLRRWSRAVGFFVAAGGLALAGYAMHGEAFKPGSGDPFGTLGFVADACSGVFYILPRVLTMAPPDLSHAAGDYGTRFIAAAGIVNLLAVIDAYGTARGERG